MARIERITPSEAKRKLASVLNTVEFGQQPVIVEKHGREIAAVIPIELYALVRDLLQNLEDEADWQEIRSALADPVNAEPLEWDVTQYGKNVPDSDSAHRGKTTAPRSTPAPTKAGRKDRRARR
jgi:prevent-host-death family protein